MWAAQPGAGRSKELPGFAEVAGINLVSVAGLGKQGDSKVSKEGIVGWRRKAEGHRSYLAGSAGPAAAGTEREAGGGGLARAPAAEAGGAAVCPARGWPGSETAESGTSHCTPKPWGASQSSLMLNREEQSIEQPAPRLRAP